MALRLLKRIRRNISSSTPIDQIAVAIDQAIEDTSVLEEILNSSNIAHLVINTDTRRIKYLSGKSAWILAPSLRKGLISNGTLFDRMDLDRDVKKYISDAMSGDVRAEEKDFSFRVGGENRTFRVSFSSFPPNRIRKSEYLDVMFEDITEKIVAETRLRVSESLASMTQMALGIAHEIKNPLQAMKIHSDILLSECMKGEPEREKVLRFLNIVEEETTRLNRIAVDFLEAVRPIDIRLLLGSINSVVEDLIVLIEPEADEKCIGIVFNPGSFLPNIEYDASAMKQCLLNIVQNAFRAMEGGGTLTISTFEEDDFVIIEIDDTGVGMSEEVSERIFDPYFSTRAGGSGIGLSIVYKIVKEHGGTVSVKSEVSKGSSFMIKLPVPASERKKIGSL